LLHHSDFDCTNVCSIFLIWLFWEINMDGWMDGCCGCHDNGRCLKTAHWPFCSYGRLKAKRVNHFWWNLVYNSKLGPQWRSRDQILKFLKFKISDGRHVGKYWKFHDLPTNGPTGMQLGWSHPIMFSTCPPCCGCHGKIKYGRKTANINTINLRSFITVKPHCSMTHLKQ